MIKDPLTYEIMTPHSVGVPNTRLVLGKHSGRHALGLRCEALGFLFDRREFDKIYRHFVVLADNIKTVEDHHLLELIQQTPSRPSCTPNQAAESAPTSTTGREAPPPPAPLPVGPVGEGRAYRG